MKAITVLLLACAACEQGVEMYPISPGGGGGGGTTFIDAAVDGQGGDGGTTLNGRVCLVNDARSPTTACATTGVAGMTVMLGAQTAMTAADGAFTIAVPTGTGLVWRVSGAGVVASAMSASNGTLIPVVTQTLYQQMLTASNTTSGGNTGSIIAQLERNGAAVANATATATPVPAGNIHYDGATSEQWDLDATGASGVVWIPSIDPGTATIQVTSGATSTFTGIPVFTNTITFVFAEL